MSPRLHRLVVRPEAASEIKEAAQWYEKRERGLGREFLRAFQVVTAVLRRTPLLYPVVEQEARRALLRRFPYSVIYEVHGSDVVVIACFHGARDTDEWQARISRP